MYNVMYSLCLHPMQEPLLPIAGEDRTLQAKAYTVKTKSPWFALHTL